MKYKLDLKVIHPDRELALQEDFEETAPKQYKGTVYVQWQKDRFVRILYVLKDKTGGEVKLHSEAEVLVYLYGQNKPVRKYNFLAHVEQAKLALLFKVERPDVTYLGDLQYDRPAPGAANTKFDLKTPWIEGQVRSKRVPNDFDGNFDFKTEKRRVIGNAKLSGDTTKKLNAVLKVGFQNIWGLMPCNYPY